MLYRNLGNTEIRMSALGLGTVKFGRNTDVKYPQNFNLPSKYQLQELLATAKDLGINVLDTAPAYGNSEQIIGSLLAGQRDQWVIVDKAGEEYINHASSYDFSRQAIISSVERSLARLQTDYIDVLLIHSNGEDQQIIEQHEIFNTLDYLRQQGYIRAAGLSSKTILGANLSLQYSDTAMISYNPSYTDEAAVFEIADSLNRGVLIKKALCSGHLDKISMSLKQDLNPIEHTFDFILKQPAVASIIIGTINPVHLTENVTAVLEVASI